MNLYEINNMSALHFLVLALMVYRLTRLIVVDTIFTPVREWIFSKKPPRSSSLGYLFTCEWCISLWLALPVVISYALFPSITLVIGYIFALSATAGLITARVDR